MGHALMRRRESSRAEFQLDGLIRLTGPRHFNRPTAVTKCWPYQPDKSVAVGYCCLSSMSMSTLMLPRVALE